MVGSAHVDDEDQTVPTERFLKGGGHGGIGLLRASTHEMNNLLTFFVAEHAVFVALDSKQFFDARHQEVRNWLIADRTAGLLCGHDILRNLETESLKTPLDVACVEGLLSLVTFTANAVALAAADELHEEGG